MTTERLDVTVYYRAGDTSRFTAIGVSSLSTASGAAVIDILDDIFRFSKEYMGSYSWQTGREEIP
jgi:hypothetical protein